MNGYIENVHDFYVLVTGANSGLGFAICCRLVDEFILTYHPSSNLHLIITTRDETKSNDTISRLRLHVRRNYQHIPTIPPIETRISFHPEQLNLTSLVSVQSLCTRLFSTIPHLNAVILNAGYGGFTGMDWPKAIFTVLTDFFAAVTYPSYKLSSIGSTTPPQLPPPSEKGSSCNPHPHLGQVFCANVFGHYLLSHSLVPLLSIPTDGGRIIWISSVEAYARTFSMKDIQGLASPSAYECSKRLTDILALTSSLPSTRPYINRFLSCPPSSNLIVAHNPEKSEPKIYLSHPGICATAIVPLHTIPYIFMTVFFYIARWLDSQWHTISPYKGACASVWLALSPTKELEGLEKAGKGKWGSCVDRWGRERVVNTEVEGWGVGGLVTAKGDGLKGLETVSEEERMEFEHLGGQCWKEMEELREEWERRLRIG